MIKQLIPEQESKFPYYVKKWTDIGLCTEPANKEKAEEGIRKAYITAGLNIPKKIIWCDSPISMNLTKHILSVWEIKKEAFNIIEYDKGSVRKSVKNRIWNRIEDTAWDRIEDAVGDNVRRKVRANFGYICWDMVGDTVRASAWDTVWDTVGKTVENSIRSTIRASFGNNIFITAGNIVRPSIWDMVWENLFDNIPGQHLADTFSVYDFFRNELNLIKETDALIGNMQIAENAGWWLPYENICFISERPNILNRDDQGRLHCLTGPALSYPDGWSIYAIHGVRTKKENIENIKRITPIEFLKSIFCKSF